jgi:thiamine-phosphate pyrophosphorylase
MPLKIQPPLLYLITSGETTAKTTPFNSDFTQILRLVETAVAAEVNLVQLREKNLPARVLYQLTEQAAAITRDSSTILLVNDRADIAREAGAHGVHLTTSSFPTGVVRSTFGADFVIGVSTHTVAQAIAARGESANFAVFGPVFATASKQKYGEPVGLEARQTVVSAVAPFPVIALGGINLGNVANCFCSGAAGIAAIRLFQDASKLKSVVTRIRELFDELSDDVRRS